MYLNDTEWGIFENTNVFGGNPIFVIGFMMNLTLLVFTTYRFTF